MAVKRNVKESVIENELIARVAARGGICVKVEAIGRRGFFDRIVALPGGIVLLIELKRPRGGRISPHQRQYHAAFRALGVEIFILKNFIDINKLFEDIDALSGDSKPGAA